MKFFRQSTANLEAALNTSPINLNYKGKACSEIFYHAVLTDEREDFELKCEIDSSWETITLRMFLPVVYSNKTMYNLLEYIDKVNQFCSNRGRFSLFDDDMMLIEKELSFSGFIISTDSILSEIFLMKANTFDFINALRCIGKGSDVPDDDSIASTIYYEIHPDGDGIADDFLKKPKKPVNIDFGEMIKIINSMIKKSETTDNAETTTGDTIEVELFDDEELP